MKITINNKFYIKILFFMIVLILIFSIIDGYKSQSIENQNPPIATIENGSKYALDAVDMAKHPFAYLNLINGKVTDIENKSGNNDLIAEQINTAKEFLENNEDDQEKDATAKYISLSSIEIHSVIVDSEKSSKITVRLNYVVFNKDPYAIEEIPIIIDDKIVDLPYSLETNNDDSSVIKTDHYKKDICLYIYYQKNKFHVLKRVNLSD